MTTDSPLNLATADSDEIDKDPKGKGPSASEKLIVKVCETHDVGVERSAQNECQILKKLHRDTIVEFVAFFEDPLINKTYLVLKYAGDRDLAQFVRDQRTDPTIPGVSKPISEGVIKSIMTQLFLTI